MKVLELVEGYPTPQKSLDVFSHVRSLEYKKQGIDVTVIKFGIHEAYMLDGIRVLPLSSYQGKRNEYDCLICHASNIRHHYAFLKKHADDFPHIIFLFLGHETLNMGEVYPPPYPYARTSAQKMIRKFYDPFKLSIWHRYLPKIAPKASFVFVSDTYRKLSLHYLKLTSKDLMNHDHVICNGVDDLFFRKAYGASAPRKYDFITIRSRMDESTYAIDFVNFLAKSHPDMKFLLIGYGTYFDHYEKAANLTFLNKVLKHEEVPSWLDQARCGLMPSRHDSQGVMSCEIATYGMPLLVSDIPVCREIFRPFPNAAYLENDRDADLAGILKHLESGLPYAKTDAYSPANTTGREIGLIREVCSGVCSGD